MDHLTVTSSDQRATSTVGEDAVEEPLDRSVERVCTTRIQVAVVPARGGYEYDQRYRADIGGVLRRPARGHAKIPKVHIPRRSLGGDHTRMVSQLHQLLLELIPGGAKQDLSAAQAKALLAKVRPRYVAGKAGRRVAAEMISDLERIYKRRKAADKELRELVALILQQLLGDERRGDLLAHSVLKMV